jgi:hypothetical protein
VNSWGTEWGLEGAFLIERGKNMVNFEYDAMENMVSTSSPGEPRAEFKNNTTNNYPDPADETGVTLGSKGTQEAKDRSMLWLILGIVFAFITAAVLLFSIYTASKKVKS